MHQLNKNSSSVGRSNLWHINLKKPLWLLSDLSDDKWTLERNVEGYPESAYVINWKYSDDSLISEEENYWIEKAKEVTYFYMESDKTKCNRTTSLALFGREYLSIFQWFNKERLCKKVEDFTPSDIKAYEGYLASTGISSSTILTKLILLRGLWKLRNEIKGGLDFDPYVKHKSLIKTSKAIGKANGHTKTIYPKNLFKLINHSLLKLESSDDLLNKMNIYLNLKESEINQDYIYIKFKKLTGESSLEMMNDVMVLYGAALVIILTLSGDRKHQLSSIKYRDVEDIINDKTSELVGKVTKTANTSTGKQTKTSVIEEFVTALKTVKEITKYKRQSYDGELFFLKQPFKHNAKNQSFIPLTTNSYYTLLDKVLIDSQVDIKKLRPHMFRKSFSMMWAWRFEIGDLHLLSKLLHHNSEAFTKIYTNDEHAFTYWNDEMKELMFDVMEEAMLGNNVISGGFSKTVNRYRKNLYSTASVIPSDVIPNYVRGIAIRHEYKMIPQSDGMCFISSSRAKYAKCSTDGLGPNYANRNEENCSRCVNFGILENRIPVWERRLVEHQKVYNSTDIPVIKDASKVAIIRITKILNQLRSNI